MAQEVLGICSVSGAEVDEPLQTRKKGYETVWVADNISTSQKNVLVRNARGWKAEGEKRRVTRKECKKGCEKNLKTEDYWRMKGVGTTPKNVGR